MGNSSGRKLIPRQTLTGFQTEQFQQQKHFNPHLRGCTTIQAFVPFSSSGDFLVAITHRTRSMSVMAILRQLRDFQGLHKSQLEKQTKSASVFEVTMEMPT